MATFSGVTERIRRNGFETKDISRCNWVGSRKACKVRHLMSDKWEGRRGRRSFDIFEEFKEIEKIMNEIMQQAYEKNKRFRPRVYVFSIRTDPRLRAKYRGRANVDGLRYGGEVKGQRESLVDVFDKEDEVVVVAELPNAKREDIELHRAGDFLTVSVNKPQRKNFKTIELPDEVNIKEAKINYKNGVLEIILPKWKKNYKKAIRMSFHKKNRKVRRYLMFKKITGLGLLQSTPFH